MTHTPGYGALIALGMLNSLKRLNHSAEEIEAAEGYLESLAESGTFLTFAGGGPLIGTRLREAESERAALRLVSESAEGIVVSGKIQMHTSTPFAEDLLITSRDEMPQGSGRLLWFIVPVNSSGLKVVSRRTAARVEWPKPRIFQMIVMPSDPKEKQPTTGRIENTKKRKNSTRQQDDSKQ